MKGTPFYTAFTNNQLSMSESTTHEVEEDGGILTTQTFASLGLCKTLSQACERLNWKTATKIQAAVLPEALQGRDIIGESLLF